MSVSKPEIHLIIPKLFEPLLLWHKDFLFEAKAPLLSTLLSQYKSTQQMGAAGFDACLFASIGILDQELPSARYRIRTHKLLKKVKTGGGVYINNSKNTLLCADPVHLEVGINDITLTEKITDLSKEEVEGVIEALNKHFSQDGFEFIYGAEGEWYLAFNIENADEALSTTPVDSVIRQNIVNYLPYSKEANWKQIQNETQMLLHSLPINTEREQQGLPTVNSLWFWGAGQTQATTKSINSIITTSATKGNMLAQAAGCDCQLLSEESNIETLLESLEGKNIIILDQLHHAAIYDDLDGYQQQLSDLDERLIKPLYLSWKSGNIDLLIDGCDGRSLMPIANPSWKFWSKQEKPLIDIAREISA